MRTRENVVEEIRPIVADVLAVEPEEVLPQARFFEELGGESIDLLDLAFHLEKHFGVAMPIQKMVGSEEITLDPAGRITDDAMALLRSEYPFLDYSKLDKNPTRERLTEAVTIEALAGFVLMVLGKAQKSEATGTA